MRTRSLASGLLMMMTAGLGCDFHPSPAASTTPSGGTGPSGISLDGGISNGRGSVAPGVVVGGRCTWTVPDLADCSGTFYSGHGITPDILVVFDVSGSMATKDDGTTMRIDAVRNALLAFLGDPESAGLGVGLGYFGTQALSCACTSCNPADYARPAVAIGALPDNLGALSASLAGATPTGETPTGAAVRGACQSAVDRKQAHPGHDVVLLLVTDGEPQAPLTSRAGGCNPTLADAVAAAAECLAGKVTVRTYVLGVGPSLQNLNQIAAAGGTAQAHLVENGGGADVLAALNRIRTDATIPCTLPIPRRVDGTPVDLRLVNLIYADANCALTTAGNVSDAAACNSQRGGWYYDPPAQPTQIQLCDATCGQVAMPGTELRVSVGCTTQVIP